jgi:uncharacterized protein
MSDGAGRIGDQLGGLTARSRVRRLPELGRYGRDDVYAVVDATCFCTVGLVVDGAPLVLPSIHVRDGDDLLLHGSVSSLLLRTMATTEQACVNVTLVDGIIVARSAFNSSIAYRSAVLFGRATPIEDPHELEEALDLLTEAVLPGRLAEVRRPTEGELRRTRVVRFGIEEASAKVSEGPPDDDVEDLDTDVWAGVVPLGTQVGTAVASTDGRMASGAIPIPPSVRSLTEGR